MSGRPSLVTVTGDGTFVPAAREDDPAPDAEEVRLAALERLRSLLGDDLEEQVATRLVLPAALGTEPADHLLPSTLSLLVGTTGDLASIGWRLGAGAGVAWSRARALRERTLEDARIALLGYEGPLAATALGPLTLAAATFLPSGERSLADPGAVRDLPALLGEGLAAQAAALVEHVPGSAPSLLVREDAAAAVHAGSIPTASGYRRHAAMPTPEMGARWQALRETILDASGVPGDALTLALPPEPALLAAACTAGWTRLAIAPAAVPAIATGSGRRAWEALAEAHDAGVALELVIDPARAEQDLEGFATAWRTLGHPASAARGLTLVVHPRPSGPGTDPAREPARVSLLTEAGLEGVLRIAPAWAERVGG